MLKNRIRPDKGYVVASIVSENSDFVVVDGKKLTSGTAKKWVAFREEANSKGYDIFITEGLRTAARQKELYNQGRFGNGGKIVTYVDGEKTKSEHQFGIALDIAFRGKKLYPDDFQTWRKVADIGIKHGLTWGYDRRKRDKPHFTNLEDEPETTFLEKVRRKMKVDFDYSIYETASGEYGISKELLFCMAGPETSYGKSMKSKNNLVNIGNTDRGDTRDFESYEDNVMKTARELHEGKYLAPLKTVGELSCAGRIKDLGRDDCSLPDTPVWATDPENWDGHIDSCLSYVFGEEKSRHNFGYKTGIK